MACCCRRQRDRAARSRIDRNKSLSGCPAGCGALPEGGRQGLQVRCQRSQAHYNCPVQSTVVEQDGVQFTRTVQAFDAFAREVTVVEANSAGQSRTSSTSYYDNPALWVNGQVARSVLNGIEQSRTEFDTASTAATRLCIRPPGAAGDLRSRRHGCLGGRWPRQYQPSVGMEAWRSQQLRMPATPEAPNGAVRTVAVDDNGWITSLTDETGATTSFSYDSMGRLRSQQFPGGDSVNWNGVTMDLQRLGGAQLGCRRCVEAFPHAGRAAHGYLPGCDVPPGAGDRKRQQRAGQRRGDPLRHQRQDRVCLVSHAAVLRYQCHPDRHHDAVRRVGFPTAVSQSSELGHWLPAPSTWAICR